MHNEFYQALVRGNLPSIQQWIAKDPSLLNYTFNSGSPLCITAQNGHAEACEFLLAQGAPIEERRDDGYTPLLIAAENGHIHIVTLLLKHKATIDHAADNKSTALSLAVNKNHYGVVNYLLRHRAKVDGAALAVAVENNNLDMVELLLKRQQKRNQSIIYSKLDDAKTPLSIALSQRNLNMLKLFFKNGAQVNKQCFGPYLPLSLAIRENHHDVIIYLLTQGASLVDAYAPSLRFFFFPNLIDALQQDTTLTQISNFPPETPKKAVKTIYKILTRNQDIARISNPILLCINDLMPQLPGMKPNQIDDQIALIKQDIDKLFKRYPFALQLQLIDAAFIELQLDACLLNPDTYPISNAIQAFDAIRPEDRFLVHNQQRLETLLFQYFAVVLTAPPADNGLHAKLFELFFQLKNSDRDLNKLLVHVLAKKCSVDEGDEQIQMIHSLQYAPHKLWQTYDLNVLEQHFGLKHAHQIMLHLIKQLLQLDNLSEQDYKKMQAHLISLPQTHSTSENDELLLLTFKRLFLAKDTAALAGIPAIKSFYDLLKQTTEDLEDKYISEQEAKQRLCARYQMDHNPVVTLNSNINGFFATSSKNTDESKQKDLTHRIS